ncbi:MAG: DNA cytosine methyltransferase [Clostridia bacterium]|nr:DNA cytosine methyltransferase [Clostridia bacterium]
MDLKCASFFAGVGGIDKGFELSGFDTIYANEFDIEPIKTYKANYNINVDYRDINNVNANEIPDFDIMLAGFPCQAFSIAGYQQGFDDEKGRGVLFFQLIRIIKVKKPNIVFLENVKNLVAHDNGKTFRIIIEALESEGYFVKYQVMNTMEYGNIPHNRERIYIVAFNDRNLYKEFDFPKPIELTTKLKDFIDFENKVEDKYYYTRENFSHYEELENNMQNTDTVYQWRRVYVRENQSRVCPTLTANMGTGGHNVPLILTKYGIRKLTPRECFNLQGFPNNFILPKNVANANLYKQAGNSVSVIVIKRIAEKIMESLQNVKKED